MVKISDSQKKNLFSSALDAKTRGENLDRVFEDFAVKTGRAKGSVRNFYYSTLKRAEVDETLRKKYLGNASLTANKIVGFSESESDDLLEKVLLGVTFGKSVRRVIAEISPDGKTALRNQNKYRNLLRLERARVERVMQKIFAEYGKCANPFSKRACQNENLSTLKKEINSLFDKIGQKLKVENESLKEQIKLLKEENALLVKRLNESEKSPLKEYFERESTIPIKSNDKP